MYNSYMYINQVRT